MNRLTLTALCLALPTSALSDQVINETLIVDGPQLCVGNDCANGETFIAGREGIKLNANNLSILFEDDSTGSFPSADWHIEVNSAADGGDNYFKLKEFPSGLNPFTVMAGAGNNALWVDSTGNVGVGTSLPGEDLHLRGPGNVGMRLESLDFGSNAWDVSANEDFFFVQNDTNGISPFVMANDSPISSLVINHGGNVGLGTFNPNAPLELVRPDAFNFFRITASGAAVNKSVDITFTGGPLGTGQLRYNIVDGDNQEMSLDANGNMVLDGTLTTAGPTCAGGCDRVFDADYPLPSITEYSQQMYAAGHLPQVGPTLPGQPVNMTEKMANMLNALEHAHIYINQLHNTVEAERAHVGQLEEKVAELTSRLDALESE